MASRRTEVDEILKYIKNLREEKKIHDHTITELKSQRDANLEQMGYVKTRLETLDERINEEIEKVDRVNKAINKAEATYEKLIESSQSLLDYLKKEYEELTDGSDGSRRSTDLHSSYD